jgi:hypothetical protein
MSYPSSLSDVVYVLYGGFPVEPSNSIIFAMTETLRQEIEAAIAPHVEKIRELGGSIVADIPEGMDSADIEVRDLPPEFTTEILALI